MTITRLGQLTAETRVLTDVAYAAAQGGLPSLSSTQAKTGTYSYHVQVTRAAFGLVFSSKTAIRLGYWMYMDSSGINAASVIYHGGNSRGVGEGANHIIAQVDAAGSGDLLLKRPLDTFNFETLASVSIPTQFATTGTWFHVGITHMIDAEDGFFSVYIDGTRVMQHVGDTRPCHFASGIQNFSNDTTHAFGPGSSAGAGTAGFTGAFVDDMFVDSIEGEADAPVPSRRFLMVLPTGAGADDEWTPLTGNNYEMVDENPNDGDASYNKALAAGLRDTFAMGDITLPVDHRIVAVVPSPFVKRLDSEVDETLTVHAWDGLDYLDSEELVLDMSYNTPVFARLTTQPDGSPWNEADFNAMQFGYQSHGDF